VAQKVRENGSRTEGCPVRLNGLMHQNEVIVAVSGYGQPEDRERSRQAGFDDHLVKPVHRDTLVAVIQQSVERHAVAT